MTIRNIRKVFPAEIRREGADTLIKRWFVPSDYEFTDPFLLFDETKCDRAEDFARGFPEHPHRGFEALTYMLSGTLRHRSDAQPLGYVMPGGAQWLTNGSGLTHDETPKNTEGLFWCAQLWINLPAANKQDAPFYASVLPESVPSIPLNDHGHVRAIAGQFEGQKGPLPSRHRPSDPFYFDVIMNSGGDFRYSPPDGFNVLIFAVAGTLRIGDRELPEGETAVLGKIGDIEVQAPRAARFLVFGGKPIAEKICWHGPFVMNAPEEIEKAMEDFAAFGPFRSDTGSGKEVSDVAE